MAIKYYTKQYAGMLKTITQSKSYFLRAFGGSLQVKDGVSDRDTFLRLKDSTTPVTIQAYNTDENTAFESGTGNSNRFGPRKEIKSVDLEVGYKDPLAVHEGIDNVTVNDVPLSVIAERLEQIGKAWSSRIDSSLGEALRTAAESKNLIEEPFNDEGVSGIFAEAHKRFVNSEIDPSIPWVAYVKPDVYNLLIESKLVTTAKHSNVNIDEQTLYKYKGFILQEVPENRMPLGVVEGLFVVDGIGIAGVGISVTRTIDSEDFNGVAIQSAAKPANYIPAVNQVGVLGFKFAKP